VHLEIVVLQIPLLPFISGVSGVSVDEKKYSKMNIHVIKEEKII
jgi:hypothetical protein